MLRRKLSKEIWWVIAYEISGKLGYLRAECSNQSEALERIKELMKEKPEFRYEYVQVM